MNYYDLNVKRLAMLLLPSFCRKPLIAAFAQSVVHGCNVIYGSFIRWRQEKQYVLTHNGQVCYLRAVLNDQFDPIYRRITITDGWDDVSLLRLYCREADMSTLIKPRGAADGVMLYRRGSVHGCDFWVNVPAVLFGRVDEERLTAIVSLYKLASKRFSINYI